MTEGDDTAPKDREKLIRAKEQWARDGRLLTGRPGDPARDRLPPGQRLVTDWPVLDLGVTPRPDPEKWRLRVDGLVERALILDWQEFLGLPQTHLTTDIHCVTGWSRFDNAWEGVTARAILEAVRPKADARHCIFYSRDGYTTNVRLDRFAGEDVLLAHRWNGEALTAEHGGPVRVVMPRWYFWKSAKWLRRIEISAVDRPGYWEERGYHNDGDPWTEERYS
ncbi:MAG: molybdopterin-dependent oxidoreductase [Alphaproteobacteria bacterium]|nr:molybdopterin-dependent oxidoreductase [Alphaproteobacteria bacterium]